jgi:hypothetical protein
MNMIRLLCLMLCMLVVGCQHVNPDVPVAEFPALAGVQTFHASGLSTLSLWRWEVDPSAQQSTSDGKPVEVPSEVQRVNLEAGANAGFETEGQQLYAVAGAVRIPLARGHYTWQLVSQETHAAPAGGNGGNGDGGGGGLGSTPPANGIDPVTGLHEGNSAVPRR